MSSLKNPMRFSISHRSIDIENYLRHPEHSNKHVTEVDVRPSEGQLYVHWKEDDEDTFTVAYDDIRHTREGMRVDCPECGADVTLKFLAAYGCHDCEYGPVDVRITSGGTDD